MKHFGKYGIGLITSYSFLTLADFKEAELKVHSQYHQSSFQSQKAFDNKLLEAKMDKFKENIFINSFFAGLFPLTFPYIISRTLLLL